MRNDSLLLERILLENIRLENLLDLYSISALAIDFLNKGGGQSSSLTEVPEVVGAKEQSKEGRVRSPFLLDDESSNNQQSSGSIDIVYVDAREIAILASGSHCCCFGEAQRFPHSIFGRFLLPFVRGREKREGLKGGTFNQDVHKGSRGIQTDCGVAKGSLL